MEVRRSDPEPPQVLAVGALAGDDRRGRIRRPRPLVLLDHQPAAVDVVTELIDDGVDPGVALAERAEHALGERRLEALALSLDPVHDRGPAVLDVHVPDE